VLAFPYLSVREVSIASDARAGDPAAALRELTTAAQLNPLSADPGRLAGTIALQTGQPSIARARFAQAIAREPGGWFAWLGAGLAESEMGDRGAARHDFTVAESINSVQPAVRQALARVQSRDPLTSDEAFRLLVVVQ
jgi:Flp pilus assembly protein TadD